MKGVLSGVHHQGVIHAWYPIGWVLLLDKDIYQVPFLPSILMVRFYTKKVLYSQYIRQAWQSKYKYQIYFQIYSDLTDQLQ